MCHFFETLKPNPRGLSVVVFAGMLAIFIFGVLDIDILFLMVTCQCIETKSITLVDQLFSHYVNNLSFKSHIITLMDEMDFIYIYGQKKNETLNPTIGSDDALLCLLVDCHYN
jgi:hypothetical protein